jgi:apolipoprotein N-acyltransferase
MWQRPLLVLLLPVLVLLLLLCLAGLQLPSYCCCCYCCCCFVHTAAEAIHVIKPAAFWGHGWCAQLSRSQQHLIQMLPIV